MALAQWALAECAGDQSALQPQHTRRECGVGAQPPSDHKQKENSHAIGQALFSPNVS